MKIPQRKQDRFLGPDLRKEIEYLTRSSFRWMGLRSSDYTKPCPCRGQDPTCTRCMRTGFLFTDYLIKAYPWQSVMGVMFDAATTRLSTSTKNIVIRHPKVINKRDFVMELASHPDTGIVLQPFRVVKMYEVQDVLPMIGDSSRREFWKCMIEERNIDDGRPGERGTDYRYVTNRDGTIP